MIETPETLFDRSQYERPDLQIDNVDGQPIDRPRLKFTGSYALDRMDPAHVALFNRLPMGAELELHVRVRVTGVAARWAVDRYGDMEAVIGERGLTVEWAGQ
jgi:hypothetical protein